MCIERFNIVGFLKLEKMVQQSSYQLYLVTVRLLAE